MGSRVFVEIGGSAAIGTGEDLVYGERGDLGYGGDFVCGDVAVAFAPGAEFGEEPGTDHRQGSGRREVGVG